MNLSKSFVPETKCDEVEQLLAGHVINAQRIGKRQSFADIQHRNIASRETSTDAAEMTHADDVGFVRKAFVATESLGKRLTHQGADLCLTEFIETIVLQGSVDVHHGLTERSATLGRILRQGFFDLLLQSCGFFFQHGLRIYTHQARCNGFDLTSLGIKLHLEHADIVAMAHALNDRITACVDMSAHFLVGVASEQTMYRGIVYLFQILLIAINPRYLFATLLGAQM